MTVEEAKSFLGRVKIHYPEFSSDKSTQKEWIRELILYDFDDVNKKFEIHLRNEEYGRNIPKLFFLTKSLIHSSEKGKINHYIVKCPKCNRDIPDEELDKHLQRCIEASTIVQDLKKYFNLIIDYNELINMSNQKFKIVYERYLNKMFEVSDLPNFKRKIILRILHPEYTEVDINEIIKIMTKENSNGNSSSKTITKNNR